MGWVTIPDATPAFEVYYDTKALWPTASLERLNAILASSDLPPATSRTIKSTESAARGAACLDGAGSCSKGAEPVTDTRSHETRRRGATE